MGGKNLVISRQTHMTTCYKTMLYKKMACCVVKHLFANQIGTTLLLSSSIKVELVKPLSLIKIFHVNTKGSKGDQRKVYIANS